LGAFGQKKPKDSFGRLFASFGQCQRKKKEEKRKKSVQKEIRVFLMSDIEAMMRAIISSDRARSGSGGGSGSGVRPSGVVGLWVMAFGT
jgi:hypothetical protein